MSNKYENEIRGPHGCGVYGYNYYGLCREAVEFAIEVNSTNKSRTQQYIKTFYDDGLLNKSLYDKLINDHTALYDQINAELVNILEKGDAQNDAYLNKTKI